MILSLADEIFDPSPCAATKVQNYNPHFLAGGEAKTRSLESANLAFGLKQCLFAPLGTLPAPRWVPQNFVTFAQKSFFSTN